MQLVFVFLIPLVKPKGNYNPLVRANVIWALCVCSTLRYNLLSAGEQGVILSMILLPEKRQTSEQLGHFFCAATFPK